MTALSSGLGAFRQAMLDADPQQAAAAAEFAAWSRWESRATRYRFNWALYQNNVYQKELLPYIATKYLTDFGLSKDVRSLYNPAYRLGEFYAGKVMGGTLDPAAGDGESEPSSLPIITDNENLRKPISQLWKDSVWQTNKDIYTRFGAVLGDVALRVVDDPAREKVYLEVIHPGAIKWVDVDPFGNVKSYIRQEQRYDPRLNDVANSGPFTNPENRQTVVTFTEEAFRDGENVVFRTYLNGQLYDWRDYPAGASNSDRIGPEWDVPYAFIPLYLCQHENVGLDWGWNCFHAGLSRFREVDDQASGLGDQIRKVIRAPMLLSGVEDPNRGKTSIGKFRGKKTEPGTEEAARDPEPGRQELNYLYAPEGADAKPLGFDLPIADVCGHIKALLEDIEQNYPELVANIATAAGDASGRALRVARQSASSKVQARRAGYDGALVRAQQGAIAIGGWRGYPGYEGFGLDSYEAGKLAHSIGHRPVFDTDPMDKIEEEQAFWMAAKTAGDAGVAIEIYLERNGWSPEQIAAVTKAKAQAAQDAMKRQQQQMFMEPEGNTGNQSEAFQ